MGKVNVEDFVNIDNLVKWVVIGITTIAVAVFALAWFLVVCV